MHLRNCLRAFLLALGVALLAPARANYFPKGAPAAMGARNIVLIYDGAPHHRNWQQEDFGPLLAWTPAGAAPRARLFDTFLFLPLVARSGRGFVPGFGDTPSNKADAEDYLSNTLFGGDGHLGKLDRAARAAASAIGAPNVRWKVIIAIPYPDPSRHDYGAVMPGGPSLDFSLPESRAAACRWYIESAVRRWNAARFQALDLAGFYWLHEAVESGDATVLAQVAKDVRGRGLGFFWIPWYRAPGAGAWTRYGFTAAIHQPNYFFNEMPESRLDDAAAYARQHGLGVELELDERALTDPAFRDKYRAYLRAGAKEGYRDRALTAWYMGVDALLRAAQSTDPAARSLYDDTFRFIAAVPIPDDASGNRVLDWNDVRLTLRSPSNRHSAVLTPESDILPDSRLDLPDAIEILRTLAGLNGTTLT